MKWLKLGFVLCLSWAATVEAYKTDNQYWTETGISFQALPRILNSDNCTAHLFPCLWALNALASLAKTPFEIRTANQAISMSVTKTLGPLQVVEARPEPDSLTEVIQAKRAQSLRLMESAEEIHRLNQDPNLDWALALQFFVSQLADPSLEPSIAARVINAYLGTAEGPHSRIKPAAQRKDASNDTGQSVSGIGVMVAKLGNRIFIEGLMDESAMASGLQPGDDILAIDGQSVRGKSRSEAADAIRGPEGTVVELTIQRQNRSSPLTLSITRRQHRKSLVNWKLISRDDFNIGYIKLTTFASDRACAEVAIAIGQLRTQGAAALILDLRDNSGGSLDQGLCIASLFVGQWPLSRRALHSGRTTVMQAEILHNTILIKSTEEGFQPRHRFLSGAVVGASQIPLVEMPTITLMNAGSASASEIVAGAFQESSEANNNRLWVAGERSFGKGTVQRETRSSELPGVVAIRTVEQFFFPSGRSPQGIGVIPNFSIEPWPDASVNGYQPIREADIYLNTLPAMSDTWVDPRAEMVARVENWVQSHGQASQIFEAAHQNSQLADYQLLMAQDVLTGLRHELDPNSQLSEKVCAPFIR